MIYTFRYDICFDLLDFDDVLPQIKDAIDNCTYLCFDTELTGLCVALESSFNVMLVNLKQYGEMSSHCMYFKYCCHPNRGGLGKRRTLWNPWRSTNALRQDKNCSERVLRDTIRPCDVYMGWGQLSIWNQSVYFLYISASVWRKVARYAVHLPEYINRVSRQP